MDFNVFQFFSQIFMFFVGFHGFQSFFLWFLNLICIDFNAFRWFSLIFMFNVCFSEGFDVFCFFYPQGRERLDILAGISNLLMFFRLGRARIARVASRIPSDVSSPCTSALWLPVSWAEPLQVPPPQAGAGELQDRDLGELIKIKYGRKLKIYRRSAIKTQDDNFAKELIGCHALRGTKQVTFVARASENLRHDFLASNTQNPIFPSFANPCFVLFVHVHKTVQNNLATGLRPVARYGKK